jgi:hypothetical protein
MSHSKHVFHEFICSMLGSPPKPKRRRTRQLTPTLDGLEDRVVLSHIGAAVVHHHHHAHHAAVVQTSTASTSSTASTAATSLTADTSSGDSSSSSSSTALQTARQTLQNDIQTIELASGTTIGELTAIHAAFQTLSSDGLAPSSKSALSSFENSLVESYANGTTLTNNATLLAQFEALYTTSSGSLTTQQTTDLTTAYNSLAAAITSSGITASDLSTIDTDYAAVLAAESSTSTDTFPYFTLVTGQAGRFAGGYGGGNMQGGC